MESGLREDCHILTLQQMNVTSFGKRVFAGVTKLRTLS